MDDMKIESKFVRGLVSGILERVVKKKLGYDVDVELNAFRTVILDERTHVHLDIDLELSKEDTYALLKSLNIGV